MCERQVPWVLHVDLDSFYVSMEQLRHPELRGQPVIVAGGLGPRAVVNTCSYEAREHGVSSAMPLVRARRLCPQAVVLAADFSFYAPASRRFHEILRRFSPLVEAAGADEGYLDLRGCGRLWPGPDAAADAIRKTISRELGLTASVGAAANKLVAKVASDAAKPDGVCVVEAGEEAAFLAPLPVRKLPMVGPKSAVLLGRLGIHRIGELATAPPALLRSAFGNLGGELQARARGVHEQRVGATATRHQSISHERTFAHDVRRDREIRRTIRSQSDVVSSDLWRRGLAARTVTLKLRFVPYETITRSASPGLPLLTGDEIFQVAFSLFQRAWDQHKRRPVRLVGVAVSSLQPRARQLRLGETRSPERLVEAVESIRGRFGRPALKRAVELETSQ